MIDFPDMEREHRRKPWIRGAVVLTAVVGIGLAAFNADVGVGASIRVPFMDSNITWAGSIGAKDKSKDALPRYIQERVGENQNFINNSDSLTIGPVQGRNALIVGKQEMAPKIIGLHFDLEH